MVYGLRQQKFETSKPPEIIQITSYLKFRCLALT